MQAVDPGIVAYVFVADAHPADLERILALPRQDPDRVHSAVRLIGTWDAMVVLTVDLLEDLEELVMQNVRGGESPETQTALAVSTVRPPGLVTWAATPPVLAFSRISTQPAQAQAVMEALAPNAMGVAMVAGAFDVLVEFGGNSFAEVASTVAGYLGSTPGIVSSDTAFSTTLVTNA